MIAAWATSAIAGSFDGKTVTYIISTKPGGGYDAYGRLVAKYMQKHLPGSTFVVKNIPGAGQRAGAETLYNSPADGLTIGIVNTSLIYGQIAGSYGERLDFSRFSYIGKAATDSRVLMVGAKSSFKSIADLKAAGRPFKIGVNGKGSSGHFESALLAKLLGIEFQYVFGYEAGEAALSILRGELDLTIGSRSSLQANVDSGDGRFVLGYGGKAEKDIPQLEDAVGTNGEKSLLALIASQAHNARVTMAPPNMPEPILQELRDAYKAALADPALLAEAAQQKLPIDYADGTTVAKVIAVSLNQPADIVVEIKALVAQGE